MSTSLLAYERARAARQAAEALLQLVAPGLSWGRLRLALAHLHELRAAESACFAACLNEAPAAGVVFEVASIAQSA